MAVKVAPAITVRYRLVRRLPFTLSGVCVLLILGVGSGGLWSPLRERPWFDQLGYGLPNFEAGRWWTVLTGSGFGLTPLFYLPIVLSFAAFVGFAEYRLGTLRTIAVVVAGHVLGTVGAAVLLLIGRADGWDWATELSGVLDVGPSSGAMAALAVGSAALGAPWRLRLRLVLIAFVAVSFLYIGTLADTEHLLAVVLILPFAGRIAGPARVPPAKRATRREWRLLAVAGLVVALTSRVVVWLVPGDGLLGPYESEVSGLQVLLLLIVTLLVARGLRHGKRVAWWVVTAFAGLHLLVGVFVAWLALLGLVTTADFVSVNLPVFVWDTVFWTAFGILLLAGKRAFETPLRGRAGQQVPAVDLLRRNGGSTTSWMTTWPDNHYLPVAGGQGYVAYRRHARVAVALGDPVGPADRVADCVAEFADACDRLGLVPCVFSGTAVSVQAAERLGWRSLQVAEDTLVDLEGLEFKGKRWQDARTALNRAEREDISFRLVTLATEPRSVLAQVRTISEEWVSDKGLPEMGFTLGGVEEALDPNVRVGLAVDSTGRVHGVTSWMPVYAAGGEITGWTLDVMRRRCDGFKIVVEFMIASACKVFQAEGARFVSLSGAPLASAGGGRGGAVLDRLLDKLGAALEPYYGFRSLHAFKAKFLPRYEPMYLLFRDEADLPRIGIAIARAYLPDADVRALIQLAKAG